MHIYQQSHQLFLILYLLYAKRQFSRVVPGGSIAPFLECDLEDIDVIVSSKDVFMRIDKLIREFVANTLHLIFSIYFASHKMIETVEPALE